MNFDEKCSEYRIYIEKYLQDYLAQFGKEPQKKLYDAMEYSLLAGGKRLRPILAFEFCRITGCFWENAAPFAAAMEMIHTYSLIHDDLPCMDNDDYRRGRLTNHKVFGEALAVLAGDALLTDAFYVASNAALQNPARMAEAIRVLAECAGSPGMVGGQVLDMLSEEREGTEQEILDIQSRKTGRLIRAACVLGVIAGGGNDRQIHAAEIFAAHLGLAFQIRDDMLDVIGNPEELGKAVGVDSVKNTFVRLYGMEKCESLVQMHTEKAIEQLIEFEDTTFLEQLARMLVSRYK